MPSLMLLWLIACTVCWAQPALVAQLPVPRPVFVTMKLLELVDLNVLEQHFEFKAAIDIIEQSPYVQSANLTALPAGFVLQLTQLGFETPPDPDIEWENVKTFALTDKQWIIHRSPPPFIPKLPGLKSVDEAVWLHFRATITGKFSSVLELQQFPFDRQTGRIMFRFTAMPEDLVLLIPTHPTWTSSATVYQAGWTRFSESTFNVSYYLDLFKVSFSRVAFELTVEREPNYYITKIVAGIAMLVIMANLTFVMDILDTNRLMTELASVLGLVTYLFVISQDVPKVPYTTTMDKFVNLSFYVCFADFIYSAFLYVLERLSLLRIEREEKVAAKATKLNQKELAGSAWDESAMPEGRSVVVAPKTGWWTHVNNYRRVVDGLAFVLSTGVYLIYGGFMLR